MSWIAQARDLLTTAPIDVAFGAGVMVTYLATLAFYNKGYKVNLSNLITVFSAGFSILPGLSVLIAAFDMESKGNGIEQSYFFIGGFAVIYVSSQEIGKKFKEIHIP